MTATISLRAYDNQLAALLKTNATDEVIFHCRHILQRYPKHATTYRHLGRALLYNNRWTEAAATFRRVLSVFPDDFVAHIGLSEIHDEHGRGDAAIWHLERACEQEPANAELLASLRDLYRRHRGLDAPRLQLTAGALARHYLGGELYEDAAAVLRDALVRTPTRHDLRLLLAEALWQSERRFEAAEHALDVLDVLPDALTANRLLAEFWLREERPSDAQRYINRVEAVDPYLAMELASGQPADDAMFMIIELDYRRYAEAMLSTDQPDWLLTITPDEFAEQTRDAAEAESPSLLSQTDQLRLKRTVDLPSLRQENPQLDLGFDDKIDMSLEPVEPTTRQAAREMHAETPSLANIFADRPPEGDDLPNWLAAVMGPDPGDAPPDMALPATELPDTEPPDTEASATEPRDTEPPDTEPADTAPAEADSEAPDPLAWLRDSGVDVDDSAERVRLLFDEVTDLEHRPASPLAWLEETPFALSEDEPAGTEAGGTESAPDEPVGPFGWMKEYDDLVLLDEPAPRETPAVMAADDGFLHWLDPDAEPAPPEREAMPAPAEFPWNELAEESDDGFAWLQDESLQEELDTLTRQAAKMTSTLPAIEPEEPPVQGAEARGAETIILEDDIDAGSSDGSEAPPPTPPTFRG